MNKQQGVGDAGDIAALGLFALAVALVVFAWPVGGLFVLFLGLWDYFRRRKKPWAEGVARLLFPLWLGFGADSLVVLLLRLFPPEKTEHPLRVGEEWLVALRIHVHHITGIGFPTLVAILLVLLGLNHFFPRWKLITRFSAAQQIASMGFATLAAMTTLTLFSDEPLEKWGEASRQALVKRFNVAIRKEYESVGNVCNGAEFQQCNQETNH
jgi:hypothetical protein